MFPEPTVIRGKKLVPRLLLFFLVFTVVGLTGTYFLARWTTPFFAKRSAQARAKLEEELRLKNR